MRAALDACRRGEVDEEKIPGAGDQSQAASVGLFGGPMAKRAVVEMDKRGGGVGVARIMRGIRNSSLSVVRRIN